MRKILGLSAAEPINQHDINRQPINRQPINRQPINAAAPHPDLMHHVPENIQQKLSEASEAFSTQLLYGTLIDEIRDIRGDIPEQKIMDSFQLFVLDDRRYNIAIRSLLQENNINPENAYFAFIEHLNGDRGDENQTQALEFYRYIIATVIALAGDNNLENKIAAQVVNPGRNQEFHAQDPQRRPRDEPRDMGPQGVRPGGIPVNALDQPRRQVFQPRDMRPHGAGPGRLGARQGRPRGDIPVNPLGHPRRQVLQPRDMRPQGAGPGRPRAGRPGDRPRRPRRLGDGQLRPLFD